MSTKNDRKLLDEVREIMRLHHYSIHTERRCCDDLKNGEKKIEAFLTHLAMDKNIAPSTQNQKAHFD